MAEPAFKKSDPQSQATLLLRRQLKDLNNKGGNSSNLFSAGLADDSDIFSWEVVIYGPLDTIYEGGVFKALLKFPHDYPIRPPEMKFTTTMWHPNISDTGDVCISILHEPGDDKYGYEKAVERWNPCHTVETIMLSVISMLADPNAESPANVEAAVQFRDDYRGFKKKVLESVRRSQEE